VTLQDPLCVLPPAPSAGCCDAPLLPPASINPPGLSVIQYRIGTFTSFRRAMLDEVADPNLLAALGNPINPFARWHEGTADDYQTMFIELWAYLADILTFYQERIANEAYLSTATQLDSLMQLAQLINYLPNPGAGASALLAFTAAKGQTASVPASFRVSSKPTPGTPAAVFETVAAINAPGEHSSIPLAQVRQVDQFAALTGNVRSVVLQGANNCLSAGDQVLVIENEGASAGERATLRQVATVSTDKTANTTTLTWGELAGTSYQYVTLYALRLNTGPFGNNAPNWNSLPPALNNSDGKNSTAPYGSEKWDDNTNPWAYLPTPGDPLNVVYLDAIHSEVKGTSDHPGWAVLVTDDESLASDTVLTAAMNADGRLEVFAVGADNALWHIGQTAPSNGWSGWASLGGALLSPSAVAVGKNADGRLEVFAVGADNALWHIGQTAPSNGWSGWASLGGALLSSSAVAVRTNADGRLEVFVVGTDSALWHIWQTAPSNGWSGWASLGGVLLSSSAVVVGKNADGRLEVFVVGTDSALWHIWQTAPSNGWSGWASLGGVLAHPPTLALRANNDGSFAVFTVVAVGTGGTLYQIGQTALSKGWGSWTSLGGPARGTPDIIRIAHLIDARPASKAAYAISSRVTRLTLRESLPGMVFPLRNTVILTDSEPLALQNSLPWLDPLGGTTLVLAGLYPKLQAGQTVIVQGTIIQSDFYAIGSTGEESGILDGAPALCTTNNVTTVTLKQSLSNLYARSGAVLLANIVGATQGETVRDEVLGSGDGSALQAYPLKQKPLTYLPSTDPQGLATVSSTLTVTVNNVLWNEQPTLLTSAANAQDYTTSLDDTGQTTVNFGDGINGAPPPTGTDNIHARYRKGLGTSGSVAAGGIAQLVDSAPGLQKVTNPLAALGGADQESIDQIRVNAPASVRTFGRAVSVADYAALALSYPGVAKASAAWVLRDPLTLQTIPQPYVQLTVATADQTPLAQQQPFAAALRSFLDGRRDPNVPLRIRDYTPVYIDVAATVDIENQYPHQGTYYAVLAALNPGLNADNTAGYFAFERLQFGQSIHLSAVYAVLQGIPGVADAHITTLRRLDQDHDPTTVRNDIFIRPTELAVIKNDPTDTGNQFGKLTITAAGGYADT
jgi:hypothetical protein